MIDESSAAPSDSAATPVLENHLGGADAPRYRAFQFELIAPHCGRSVLEVGAGLGEFAEQFDFLDRQVLTDVEPYCLESLNHRFQDRPQVEVREWLLPGAPPVQTPVDTVIALNVLEHIPDDVGALRSFAAATVPGGKIVLWVPGYQALYGDFDRRVGHVRRYTPSTLAAAGRAAGLEVESVRPVNLLGGMAWWLAVRLGRAGQANPRLIRVYDRTLVPMTRFIEGQVTPPFGQSILGVLKVPVTQESPSNA